MSFAFHKILQWHLVLLTVVPVALSLPSFTHTHGYREESTQLCTTSFAPTSAAKAIPTYTSVKTVQARVVIVLTNSLPAETVTETSNAYTDTTTTIDTITNTFYSTSTELSTVTVQSTATVKEFQTETISSTTTSVTVVPTPPGFQPIADSAGIVNATLSDINAIDQQQARLELRGTRDQTFFNLEDGLAHNDAVPVVYPAAVTCNDYIKPTWTEIIALLRQTKIVTAARSTVTATVTDTLTSTFTEAPSVSTTLTSTETTFTTETAVETTTEVQTTTTSILATVASTAYDACASSNVVGPRAIGPYADDAVYLNHVNTGDRFAQVHEDSSDAYQCCAICQSKEFCALSFFRSSNSVCYLYLDPNQQCEPDEHVEQIQWNHRPKNNHGLVFSNGRCGSWELRPWESSIKK